MRLSEEVIVRPAPLDTTKEKLPSFTEMESKLAEPLTVKLMPPTVITDEPPISTSEAAAKATIGKRREPRSEIFIKCFFIIYIPNKPSR